MAIPGSIVASGKLVTPGGAQGVAGGTGPAGPTAVSTDAGNLATLGSDNLISVPSSGIWSVRLRSFNAVGNPNFEVDQRNVGQTVSVVTNNMLVQDRWKYSYSGTLTAAVSVGQQLPAGGVLLPSTSFTISRAFHRITLTTAQATLAAGDFFMFFQNVEGPLWRELQNDVHSIQLLVRSSVAGLKFGLILQDNNFTHSLSKLCTIASANTWTLVSLPNIPIWTGSGSFSSAPGSVGYFLYISLAGGSTYTAPANDTWQNGNFIAANGQSNFLGSAVNSTFDIAFCQHEPGPCTTLMDLDFDTNLSRCLRYVQKTYSYAVKPGTVTQAGMVAMWLPVASTSLYIPIRFVKPMAKVPTVTIWNPLSGNSGAYSYNGTAADTTATPIQVGDSGFCGILSSGAPVAGSNSLWHYTADTGW